MKEAIILCGGRGLRLKGFAKLPKGLMKYKEKAIIDWQIEHLTKYGYDHIVLACGYKWHTLKEHFKSKSRVELSVEKKKLGTSGALKQALEKTTCQQILVLNVDDLMYGVDTKELNINELEKLGTNLIVVTPLRSPYGIVEFGNGWIQSFREKPILPYWINAGWYFFSRDIPLVEKGDLEKEVFPTIGLKVYKYEGFWKTFDTPKDFEENN